MITCFCDAMNSKLDNICAEMIVKLNKMIYQQQKLFGFTFHTIKVFREGLYHCKPTPNSPHVDVMNNYSFLSLWKQASNAQGVEYGGLSL
jgi:hypothetical protein